VARSDGRLVMECTYSAGYFEQLLGSDADVDLAALRDAAQFGCPPQTRAEAWRYLLGLAQPDKSEEMTRAKKMREDLARAREETERFSDPVAARQIRVVVSRIALHKSLEETKKLERVEPLVLMFLANHQAEEFQVRMVHLTLPLLEVFDEEVDLYFGFEKVWEFVETTQAEGVSRVIARFLTLFRTFEGDLCGYFEDEGLTVQEWAVPWIQDLLAQELSTGNVLRLWDTYFSRAADVDFQIFVCLSILYTLKESLMEFDYSEIKDFLQNLPPLDIEQVLVHAYNIRDEVRALQSYRYKP